MVGSSVFLNDSSQIYIFKMLMFHEVNEEKVFNYCNIQ